MLEIMAAVSVFIAVTGLLLLIFRSPSQGAVVEQRLEAARRPLAVERELEGSGLLKRGTSRLPFLREFLSQSSWSDRAWLDVQRAGLPLRVSEYLLIRFFTGALGFVLMMLLTGGSALGIVLMIVAAVVGFMLPAWYVHVKKSRRQATIGRQLVECLQLISNALRSGFAFTQAVELAAKQVTAPMKDELDHFLRDNALGARTDDALKALADRTGSVDVEMMVTSIMVQRTTGGNLSEILENVAETVRERERLQGEIRALTAQQRLTGFILSIYPLVLAVLFFLLAPSVMKVLWEEEVGRVLLVIAGTLQVIGFLTIRQVLKLEV